jgi:hypothetical protein
MNYVKNNRPAQLTEKEFDEIWPVFMSLCSDQSKNFVQGLKSKKKQMFHSLCYSALFHNGHLNVNFELHRKAIDIGYIPIIQSLGAQSSRMADIWMLGQFQQQATIDDHLNSLLEEHRTGTDGGGRGEDLLAFILLSNKDKQISSLAVLGSQFHGDSLARKFCVNVVRAATMEEFGYDALQVLTDPMTSRNH